MKYTFDLTKDPVARIAHEHNVMPVTHKMVLPKKTMLYRIASFNDYADMRMYFKSHYFNVDVFDVSGIDGIALVDTEKKIQSNDAGKEFFVLETKMLVDKRVFFVMLFDGYYVFKNIEKAYGFITVEAYDAMMKLMSSPEFNRKEHVLRNYIIPK